MIRRENLLHLFSIYFVFLHETSCHTQVHEQDKILNFVDLNLN